jgi:hypothetical protein
MAAAASLHLPHFATTAFGGVEPDAGFTPLVDIGRNDCASEQMDAIAAAREEALVEARAEFEQIRAADRAEHERCLEERERQFAETTGGVLIGHLSDGLAEIERALSDQTARVLARFLDKAVRERALGELSETVAALIAGGGAVTVKIVGPEPLLARLRQLLDTSTMPTVDLVVGTTPEVTVTIDDTIIETHVSAWMDRINAAIEGEERG